MKHKLFEEWLKSKFEPGYFQDADTWIAALDATEVFQWAEKFGEDLQFVHAIDIANIKGETSLITK